MKPAWAQESQWLHPVSPSGRSWAEQGIVCHTNLLGTPNAVFGCRDRDGLMWRITNENLYSAFKQGLLDWESENGWRLVQVNQQTAVNVLGIEANLAYNPWVSARSNMGINTPDGWSRLFPERLDLEPQTPGASPTKTGQDVTMVADDAGEPPPPVTQSPQTQPAKPFLAALNDTVKEKADELRERRDGLFSKFRAKINEVLGR